MLLRGFGLLGHGLTGEKNPFYDQTSFGPTKNLLKLTRPPLGQTKMFSKVGSIVLKATGSATRFQHTITKLDRGLRYHLRHVLNSLNKPNHQYLALIGGYLNPTNWDLLAA
jgi:hypothetical protein